MKFENFSKTYTDKVGYKIQLLRNISVNIDENQIVSILAPIGAGKSSLLKIIAGIEKPNEGKPEQNNEKIIFIPSEPSSFPWFSVKENLKLVSEKITENELMGIISLVGLKGYEDHRPHNKSLGFRFRISLARVLILEPDLIVLDEPFDKMKPETKDEIYSLIIKINKEEGQRILLATTNISEAIFLSDKIYLMKKNPGEIIDEISLDEEKTPAKIYQLRKEIEEKFRKILDREYFEFKI